MNSFQVYYFEPEHGAGLENLALSQSNNSHHIYATYQMIMNTSGIAMSCYAHAKFNYVNRDKYAAVAKCKIHE